MRSTVPGESGFKAGEMAARVFKDIFAPQQRYFEQLTYHMQNDESSLASLALLHLLLDRSEQPMMMMMYHKETHKLGNSFFFPAKLRSHHEHWLEEQPSSAPSLGFERYMA